VRGLSERDLTSATAWRAIRREGLSAFIIGIIFAVAMAGVAYIWFADWKLAAVAFVAMIINHVFAGLAGILIPLGLKRAGADPAVSSSVFVTTVTDVVGFASFLGFAAMILL
jgi:magnesium transporter